MCAPGVGAGTIAPLFFFSLFSLFRLFLGTLLSRLLLSGRLLGRVLLRLPGS